jgi:hypothetical protein
MYPVHFRANYLPDVAMFKVEVSTPEERHVELMTVERFLEFAENDTSLVVSGNTIVFTGRTPEETKKAREGIHAYFKSVAKSFKDSKYYP